MNKPKPDFNQIAVQAVKRVADLHEAKLPADVEAAWEAWIKGIQKIDDRIRTLLRAAFEVGAEAATRNKRHE
jgi:hypothetical protein